MKPSEIYALATGHREPWTEAVHLDVDAMFGRPPSSDWTSYAGDREAEAEAVPLSIEVKLRGHDQDDPDSEVRWTVWNWRGRPFGVTLTAGGIEERVVTDPVAYRQAHLALVDLHVSLSPHEVADVGDQVDLDAAGGVVLVREADRGIRAMPARFVSDTGTVLLDPDRLRAAASEAFDVRDRHWDAPGLRSDSLATAAATALLGGADPSVRRAPSFDAAAVFVLLPPGEVGWVGLLVADGGGTYAVGVPRHLMLQPAGTVDDNVTTWRVGGPEAIDRFSTGPVLEPGEEPAPSAPSP